MKLKILKIGFVLPLCLFIVLAGFLMWGLRFKAKDEFSITKSTEKPIYAPSFYLSTVEDPKQMLTEAIFKGKISVVNVWASWCVTCKTEHEIWMQLSKQDFSFQKMPIQFIGLNYHDTLKESQEWLQRAGNPYLCNLFDSKGVLAIDFGVYGTPETFILDQSGVIRYRHIGPITLEKWQTKIVPEIISLDK